MPLLLTAVMISSIAYEFSISAAKTNPSPHPSGSDFAKPPPDRRRRVDARSSVPYISHLRSSIASSMNPDMSAPPSPASDSSSASRSSASDGAIEPMDLTDFIGSLNEDVSSRDPKSSRLRKERTGSTGAGGNTDNMQLEKEWKRLLDPDFDYSKILLCMLTPVLIRQKNMYMQRISTSRNRAVRWRHKELRTRSCKKSQHEHMVCLDQ